MKTYELIDLKKEYSKIKKEITTKLTEVIESSDFILGKEVRSFEKSFAHYCRTEYCVGVSSGTSALFLVLKSLGIKENDEIILPSHTFASDAEAIINLGAKPVFADVDADTFLITADSIKKAITPKTKAVIVVHLYGLVCDMDTILELCNKIKLPVIEDCAQSHGATYKTKMAGSFGYAGIFSFFPAKNLGCFGDGGAIVTNSSVLYEKIKSLRNHGRKESKYLYYEVGFNERLDNIQAAVLNVKLQYLDSWNKKRNETAKIYSYHFKNSLIKTQTISNERYSSFYVYTILSSHRDKLKEQLNNLGIKTGIYYPVPLHLQPAYSYLKYKKGDLPITERLCEHILSIPMHPFLSKADATYISKQVLKCSK